jgi:hypothetical protein
MAEIYRDAENVTLSLGVTGATSVSAVIKRDGVTVATPSVTSGAFTLPYSVTAFDGPFTVEWTFTHSGVTTTRSEIHEVVTPYVTVAEIREALPDLPSTVDDAQLIRTERLVRKIVDRYVGHNFGKYVGSLRALGRGDSQLRLPDRLISLTGITGNYVFDAGSYETRGDGYYLAVSESAPDGDWVFTNVIAVPDTIVKSPFKDGRVYTLTGEWGWDSVPVDVKEAMFVLIENRLCPTTIYRDKYVTQFNYADTIVKFDPRAYQGTGDVVADQLLFEYKRTHPTVI